MSDWIADLSREEAEKAWALNGHRQFDRADLETAMRAAVAKMGTLTICSVCQQEAAHPELRGTAWGKKDGSSPFYSMSWSRALIQAAGGLDRLFAEWEQKP